jgi:simple sugar transport system substrate-binding protein
MKKVFAVLLAAVLLLGVMSGCSKTEDKSSTPTGDSAPSSEPAESEAPAASKGDDKFEIVMLVKTEGLAWFDDMRRGVEAFQADHPDDVICYQIAPEGADAAKQAAMMEDLIASGVDAICIHPSDPDSMIAATKKAKEAGIVVISHEAESLAGIVDWDLEAVDNELFGAEIGKQLAEAMGGKGKYVGAVGGLTMETHMQWFNAGVSYIKENYPEMELLQEEPFEDNIDVQHAYDVAKEVLKAYPDLDGYLCSTTESSAGMARLLQETNNTNVKIACLSIPSLHGDYIKNGWITYGQTWSPADSAYAIVNVAYKMLNGEEIKEGIDLEKPGYESCTVKDGIIKGNAILVLDPENVDDYPF